MYKDQQQLLQTLVSKQLINRDAIADIQRRAAQAKIVPEQLLISEGLVDEEQLIEVKAQLLALSAVVLDKIENPQKVLTIIPQEVAKNYQVVAFKKEGQTLHVGIVNPQDFRAIEVVDLLAKKSGFKIEYAVISQASLERVLKQYKSLDKNLGEREDSFAYNKSDFLADINEEQALGKMERVTKSAPVSKIVLVIFKHAIDGRSSDIHIEPGPQDVKVRYRIDGLLKTSLVLPKYIHSAVVNRIKVLANLDLNQTRLPQDGRIRLTIEGRDVDLRVSVFPVFEGEKVVLRILDSRSGAPDLETLGFSDYHITLIKQAIDRPHGLILLAGPAGSGKTTTLYTILQMLSNKEGNIVTLEDPIEYYMTGVNQSQVDSEVGFTFAVGLRSILRQDPNVIMLGEISNEEVVNLAVQASLSGQLLLSSVHANNAVGAISRLSDLKAEPFLFSSVVNLILAQRLARRVCQDCKVKDQVAPHLLKKAKVHLAGIDDSYLQGIDATKLVFWRGKGCANCGDSGYRGRIVAAEIIEATPEIKDSINKESSAEEIAQELSQQKFITLTQDCLIKALRGLTTLEEVVRVSQL